MSIVIVIVFHNEFTYNAVSRCRMGLSGALKRELYTGMNSISVNQYKGTDLAILAVITAVFEAITTAVAANLFAFEQYTLSTTIVMVCIVMMR